MPEILLKERVKTVTQLPKLVIATRCFGASGQPWLWRQVVDLKGFEKQVLCWAQHNTDIYPAEGMPVVIMPGEPAPYDGPHRWWLRLRNCLGGNFYASARPERRRVDELLRRERPSVILCYFGDIAMRLLPSAMRHQVPVVAYFHGDFEFLYNRWYRWSVRRCLRNFAAIAVVTQAERNWLLRHGTPASRIEMVPCGLPTNVFRPALERAGNRVRFAMVSRLSPEKGCHLSIRAFAQVASRLAGSELHVYGDGPERGGLEQLTKGLDLQERIFFHGYVREQVLAKVLPSHDIFIQHSLQKEGSPVSIVEAMACALPVVATPVGGIVEQVIEGETGLLVAEHDVAAMANAMEKLAGDPELRRQLGQAARERAVRLFDSTALTRRLEQVVFTAAGRRPHRGDGIGVHRAGNA